MRRTIFTDEHEMFRQAFRQFVEKEISPHHLEWEADGIVPRSLFTAAGASGFLGMAVPEQYGGGGVDDFRYNLIIGEEVQRSGTGGAGLGLTLHNDICLPYFLSLANEEQKARWLPGICSGELITAIAMTEPGIGSDLASMGTTAIRDGDHYVVNGSKTFITNGINADLVITAVKTDPSQRHKGMSLVVLERGMDGFERGRNLEKIGLHSQDTAELFFNDVPVPVTNLLGSEGQGFVHLVHNLPQERLSIAAAGVAAAEAALGWTLEYVDRAHRLRSADRRVPEQPVPAGRDAHRDRPGPGVRRPLRRGAQRGRPQRRGGRGGQVVVHRAAEAGGRHVRPAARRLRLHARVPDRPCLRGRPHHHDLRRHHRDHEGDHRSEPRGLT